MGENEYYELVPPDFIDSRIVKIPKESIHRLDIRGDRYYAKKVDDQWLYSPSVTTILSSEMPKGEGLIKWIGNTGYDESRRIANISAHYGTFLHICFKDLLKGSMLSLKALRQSYVAFLEASGENLEHYDIAEDFDRLKHDLLGMVAWIRDYSIEPIALEYTAWSPEYSGCIDIVCHFKYPGRKNSVIALGDFKSGRKGNFYPENEVQLHMYKALWNAEHPDLKVQLVFNYGCKDYRLPFGSYAPYRFKNQTRSKNAYKAKYYVKLFKSSKVGSFFRVKDDANISLLGKPSDYIEEVDLFANFELAMSRKSTPATKKKKKVKKK